MPSTKLLPTKIWAEALVFLKIKLWPLEEGASSDAFNEVEKALLAYTDDLVANPGAGATFETIASHLNAEEMVELTLAITFYIMTSKFLITFDIDLEPED